MSSVPLPLEGLDVFPRVLKCLFCDMGYIIGAAQGLGIDDLEGQRKTKVDRIDGGQFGDVDVGRPLA